MRTPVLIDGRNLLDPVLHASGRARSTRASVAPPRCRRTDGGDHPRRWKGRAARGCRGGTAEVARPGRWQAAARVADRASACERASSRVIVSCAAGQEAGLRARPRRTRASRSSAPASRSGSGVAARSASPRSFRRETGDVLAMNGDELVDVDFAGLLARHRATGAAATVTVAQPPVAVRAGRARRR